MIFKANPAFWDLPLKADDRILYPAMQKLEPGKELKSTVRLKTLVNM